jgi:DnaJ-class molecular chaperone
MEIGLGKLKAIEVNALIECPDCKGTGIIQHPAWARYWQQFGTKGNMLPESEYRLWWSSQGYDSPPPNEEVECPLCNGEGTKEVHILLSTED